MRRIHIQSQSQSAHASTSARRHRILHRKCTKTIPSDWNETIRTTANFIDGRKSNHLHQNHRNHNPLSHSVMLSLLVTFSSAHASGQAFAFTVGGDQFSTNASSFPRADERFIGIDRAADERREEEERYSTKDLVLDFVSPVIALRVVNFAFNGGIKKENDPKWLDVLCVLGVLLCLFVFVTDNAALDNALR